MGRVHNFNAGPAAMPLAVLERTRDELCELGQTGMSVMEHSHRGKAYEAIHHEAIALLRKLLGIADGWHVLFLQGGASMQFVQVPMNLLGPGRSADYVVTGAWGEKALDEARLVGTARVAATTAQDGTYARAPRPEEIRVDPAAAYVHVTTNETIHGVQWSGLPDAGSVPIIADMSSDILSRRIDAGRFALLYAGAQKNLGPSGVTIVVVRKDLCDAGRKDIPKFLRYATHASNDSLYNTPPTFAVYVMRNVLQHLDAQGGLPAIERANDEKARALYGALARHAGFYRCPVEEGSRSIMNVVWRLPSAQLEDRFVEDAKKQGMVGLKGHRSVGGIRASIYNAVSLEAVTALASFADAFARANG